MSRTNDFPSTYFETIYCFVIYQRLLQDASDLVNTGTNDEDGGLGCSRRFPYTFKTNFNGLGILLVETPENMVDVWDKSSVPIV